MQRIHEAVQGLRCRVQGNAATTRTSYATCYTTHSAGGILSELKKVRKHEARCRKSWFGCISECYSCLQ